MTDASEPGERPEHPKSAPADRETAGPLDASEANAVRPYVDLGGVKILPRPDLGLRLEVEEGSKRVVAVALDYAGSTLQVQPFAAPRSSGLWHEIREQIVEQLQRQGGNTAVVNGPFGLEVRAEIPAPAGSPPGSTRLARFVGVDGPRWFLRGVISGQARRRPGGRRARRGAVPQHRRGARHDPDAAARPHPAAGAVIGAGRLRRRPARCPGNHALMDDEKPPTDARVPVVLGGDGRRREELRPRQGDAGRGADRRRALLGAMGGIRGLVESILPGLMFLIVFTITKQVLPSVLAPLAVSLVFIIVRIATRQPVVTAIAGALGIGISAGLALWTGNAVRQLRGRALDQRDPARR